MNCESITVLAIDDDAEDAELLRRCLERIECFEIEFVHVTTSSDAKDALSKQNIDVVFLDYDLGPETGIQFLEQIRTIGDLRPVIALTGLGDEYVARDLLQKGADDYLAKRDISSEVLRRSIESVSGRYHRRSLENLKLSLLADLKVKNDALEQKNQRLAELYETAHKQTADLQRTSELLGNLNAELAQASRIDGLTGLLRRQAWEESMTLEHERSIRYGHPYSIVMLDVDQFKMLNDALGHQRGDDCLRAVAQCVADHCRRTDMVGRYGGEEFVALLVETDQDGAAEWAERLRQVIFDANLQHPKSTIADRVTVSLGVATFAPNGGEQSWERLIGAADGALYQAKRSGRNRVCTHSETPQPDLVGSRPS